MRPSSLLQIISSSSSSASASASSSHSLPAFPHHYNLPGSWNQLLNEMGVVEEERCRSFVPEAAAFYPKVENWENLAIIQNQHGSCGGNGHYYVKEMETLAVEADGRTPSPWNQHLMMLPAVVLNASSTSPSNMLDFTNETNAQKRRAGAGTGSIHHHHPRPKCDGTEIAAGSSTLKKPRMNQATNFKVRKEKVGDRITILHQLVSPFGKTDTASVLLEAIGYIRFLHGQVQVLSSPYLGPAEAGRTTMGDSGEDDVSKDLKSRGLCVVPMSCTMHVGSDNGADYWTPAPAMPADRGIRE